ncbi:MAG: hypothetical protein ACHQU8_03080 [Gemmatimonadales bacterium]
MTERQITVDGEVWTASIAGRVTVYEKDEFPVVFARKDEHGRKVRRVSRFSPLGTRSRSAALEELSLAELEVLFRQSQPDWTSPELGYAR